jgi:glycerol-3-phosphate dehydrogenase (NAD(P)+)
MDPRMAVIGGGAWGTALAIHLARQGNPVRLWLREEDLVARIRERRDNPAYLPGVEIPDSVVPTSDLPEAVRGARMIVAAVPSHHARQVYRAMRDTLRPGVPLVVATKGFEEGTLALPLDVAADVCGAAVPLAVLSGPTFADEVARGAPTAAVVAGGDPATTVRIREAIGGGSLRLYSNTDPIGVQVAGAVKNVIALAAGMADGLGLGHNALAALVTRGIAEIRRLGLALGGRAETFAGLAGLGDLVLTCTGDLSRNRRLGVALARGERLEDFQARHRSVAEGVRTSRAARDLARRHGVGMPIVEEVHRILFEGGAPSHALSRLLARPMISEEEGAEDASSGRGSGA